jgi:hypothetical protein
MAVEEEADSQVSDVSANDGEDGPGESVEEEGDEGYEEEESVRRTPVKTASRTSSVSLLCAGACFTHALTDVYMF